MDKNEFMLEVFKAIVAKSEKGKYDDMMNCAFYITEQYFYKKEGER